MVAIVHPGRDQITGVDEVAKQRLVQELIAHPAVEAFHEAVPQRLARGDVTPFLVLRFLTIGADQFSWGGSSTIDLINVGPGGGPVYSFYGTADREVRERYLPALGEEIWGLQPDRSLWSSNRSGDSLLTLFKREAGRRLITLDPNVRLDVEPDVGRWLRRIDAFAAHADLVKVSDEDLNAPYPGDDHKTIAGRWLASGEALRSSTLSAPATRSSPR